MKTHSVSSTVIDQVVALGRQIAILREELADKKAELAGLLRPSVPTVPVHVAHGSVRTLHGSIAERVRSFISANPGRAVPVAEIIAAHRTEDAATIRSTVHRLATGGMEGFSAVGHGMYRYDHERPLIGARVDMDRTVEARS